MMGGMDDLVAFLRTRMDEEKRGAEEALKRTTKTRRRVGGEWVEDTAQPPEWRWSVWSPQRVLAEVDAKRNLLSAAIAAKLDYDHWHARPPADPEFRAEILAKMTARWSAWSYALTQLALPYAEHPDYREEWRP